MTPVATRPAGGVGEVRNLALLRRIPQLILNPLAAIGAAEGCASDITEYRFAGRSTFVVNESGLVHEVLTSSRRFVKPTLGARFTLWFGPDGLPSPDAFRELAKAGFVNRRVDGLVDEIDEAIATMLPRLDYHAITATPIDLTQVAMRAALLASGRSLFGTDLRRDAPRLERALDEIQRYYAVQGPRIALGLPDVIRTPSSRRVREAAADLRAVTARLIAAREAEEELGDDLLSLLLDNCRRDGSFGRQMVENIVMSALLSSFETTGCALAWTFALLAANSRDARAIARESDALEVGPLTVEALGRAENTRAVLREVLRLYPPSWIILREAHAVTSLGGCRVRRGATVMISPYWVHRDARRWPDPATFRAERFAPAAAPPAPGSYIPFGAGAHACFGERFAMHVAQVLLLRLLGRYELCPVSAVSPAPKALISLRPDGPVNVRLVRRGP